MKIVVLAHTKLASRMPQCCYAYARVVSMWLLGGNKSKYLSNPSLKSMGFFLFIYFLCGIGNHMIK